MTCGGLIYIDWGALLDSLALGGFRDVDDDFDDDDLYHMTFTATLPCDRCWCDTDIIFGYDDEEDFIEARDEAYTLALQAYFKMVTAMMTFARATSEGKKVEQSRRNSYSE